MEPSKARDLLAGARVGHLATITTENRPHIVPCCHALLGDRIYSAVDAKPKTTVALRRLGNLRANPAASLMVDHYDEDWSSLWWIRVDGQGRVVVTDDERDRALHLLAEKYAQYSKISPSGPVIALDIEGWRSWP